MPQRTTTAGEIVSFWRAQPAPPNIQIDWREAHRLCWRCAVDRSRLERCHIIPSSLGGRDAPENYVLLCAQCHVDAPDVPGPHAMWDWIASFDDDSPVRGYYWQWQRMKAALDITGPIHDENFSLPRFSEAISRAELHHGRFSPATIAWCMKQAMT